MRVSIVVRCIKFMGLSVGALLVSACDLFRQVETPYFAVSYYVLSFANTEAVIEADRNNSANPNPPPVLTPQAWRSAVFGAVQQARNGAVHPSEIAASVLTQLGGDPGAHADFGVPVCGATADIAASDFEVPGDEVDLGSVSLQMVVGSTGTGPQNCNVPAAQRPTFISALGPQNWPNGSEQTANPFIVSVNSVDWTSTGLANKITVTYRQSEKRGAGDIWFVAANQTQNNWVDNFDRVLVATPGGFILEE